jgi:hypothetical protein
VNAQRNGMTGARWRELLARKPAGVRYIHVSCEAYMTADPRGAQYPAIAVVENRAGTRSWPVEKQRRGLTFNVGMSKEKRRLRWLRENIRRARRMQRHADAVNREVERIAGMSPAMRRQIAIHDEIARDLRAQDALAVKEREIRDEAVVS